MTKVLFAGSTEAALREMFSRASAPFYNGSPLEPFPLLGPEFVEAMVKQMATVAKQSLSLTEAMDAFTELKETPEFFRWFIERYLMYQQQGVDAALQHTLSRVHDGTSYAKIWKALKRADRAVLLLPAKGVQDLYSGPALKQLQDLLDEPETSASATRTWLRRLTAPKLQLLAKVDHGMYRFEDPEFQSWVMTRRTIE